METSLHLLSAMVCEEKNSAAKVCITWPAPISAYVLPI